MRGHQSLGAIQKRRPHPREEKAQSTANSCIARRCLQRWAFCCAHGHVMYMVPSFPRAQKGTVTSGHTCLTLRPIFTFHIHNLKISLKRGFLWNLPLPARFGAAAAMPRRALPGAAWVCFKRKVKSSASKQTSRTYDQISLVLQVGILSRTTCILLAVNSANAKNFVTSWRMFLRSYRILKIFKQRSSSYTSYFRSSNRWHNGRLHCPAMQGGGIHF